MALTKAEQTELDELRMRATNAEKIAENAASAIEEATAANTELRSANENLATANNGLVTANDEANVKIAEAAIEKQNAIDEAVAEKEAEMLDRVEQAKGGRVDKSVSPEKPLPFDRGAYFSECHGDDVNFAQNGWFYNHEGKPVRPINKPKKK